jgi:ankyrin repeat protein
VKVIIRNGYLTVIVLSGTTLYAMEGGQNVPCKNSFESQQRVPRQSELPRQDPTTKANTKDNASEDMPFLINSVCKGDSQGVEYILKKGTVAVDTEIASGRTPLYFAVMGKQINVIATLLKYGASIERVYKNPDVQARLKNRSYDEVKLALEGSIERSQEVNLEEAINNNNPQVVARILESPPLIVEPYFPFTMKQVTKEQLASFDVLAKAIEQIGTIRLSKDRQQAFAIVKLLIRANPTVVQIAYQDGKGLQLAHVAAQANAAEVIMFLLDQGADKNAIDGTGSTALYYALAKGNLMAANTLLMYGADSRISPSGTTLQGQPLVTPEQLMRTIWGVIMQQPPQNREIVQREYPQIYEWCQNIHGSRRHPEPSMPRTREEAVERRRGTVPDLDWQELEDWLQQEEIKDMAKSSRKPHQSVSSAVPTKNPKQEQQPQWVKRLFWVSLGLLAGYTVYKQVYAKKLDPKPGQVAPK